MWHIAVLRFKDNLKVGPEDLDAEAVQDEEPSLWISVIAFIECFPGGPVVKKNLSANAEDMGQEDL